MNAQKWVKISYGLFAVVLFFVFDQILSLVWDMAGWSFHEEWAVGPTQVGALVLSGVLFFALQKIESANVFMTEVVIELSKVTWPQRKETVQSAIVVIFMLAITSVLLFFIDSLWGSLTQRLLIQ